MSVRSAATATTKPAAQGPPAFAQRSQLLRDAYSMALEAHHGSRRRGKTDIGHPVAVAEVLFEYGIRDEEVIAAAFLHDVIEDTDIGPEEIGESFGKRVRCLVEEMTEDATIESYSERKAEHRRRISRDDSVSAIYAADKLASSRDLSSTRKGRIRSSSSITSRPLSCSARHTPSFRSSPICAPSWRS